MDEFTVGEAVARGWVDNGGGRVQKVGVATEEEDVGSDKDGGVGRREKWWFEALGAEDSGLLSGGGGGSGSKRERERYLSGGRVEGSTAQEREEDESVNGKTEREPRSYPTYHHSCLNNRPCISLQNNF